MISANAISLYSPAAPVQAPVRPAAVPQPAAAATEVQTRDAVQAGAPPSGSRGTQLDIKV